jgi:LysM repeat protein
MFDSGVGTMSTFRKLAVVSAVVITGGSTALMFSKETSPLRFWRRSNDPFGTHIERRVGGSTWQPGPQFPLATAAIEQTAPAPTDPQFHQSMRPVGSLLAPIENIPDSASPQIAPAPVAEAPSASFSAVQQYHRVEDGDTLTALAVRYLGRADGYRQIFELNRDVLSSPDLLPIGAVLKIPARAGGANAPVAETTSWQGESAGPMVPVPPRPLFP